MQVDVYLLLLGTVRPIRCHVVWGKLHAHDPLAVDHDAVPVLVAVHHAAEESSPKPALGFDIAGVKHNDPPDDLHVGSCPVFPNENDWRVRPDADVVIRPTLASRLIWHTTTHRAYRCGASS